MSSNQKKRMALAALNKSATKTKLAEDNRVSRKFVREEEQRLALVVDNHYHANNDDVLFTIQVTAALIEQIILALGLITRASYREIIYFFESLFDYSISLGKVNSVFQSAIQSAKDYHASEDFSAIKIPCNDELYHLNKPILNGVDTHSLYCYLLSNEDKRDEDTWAIHLLEAKDKGFDPEVMISDEAKGFCRT